MSKKVSKTEAEMLSLLRRKYTQDSGNGPAFAFVSHVRNDAGFNASRTIDAMAMSLWPSRGLCLYAFEIKCSRSDWLNEMRNPAKAEAFIPFVDYFYLVVADREIVQGGELPITWGLLAPHGPGLRVVTEAPKLEPSPLDRGMLAALLRQAGLAAQTNHEIEAARNDGYQEGKIAGEQRRSWELEHAREREKNVRERERKLTDALGHDMMTILRTRPDDFTRAVRAVLDGERDVRTLQARIQRVAEDAKGLGEYAERLLDRHTGTLADDQVAETGRTGQPPPPGHFVIG